jgi:hypothetical protein
MAIIISIGLCLSLGGSFFLWGPVSQLKKSLDPDRRVSFIILILMIICVITFAFLDIIVLCIIFVILQYAAYLWYTICMLPYG